jgi:hypothetical protein
VGMLHCEVMSHMYVYNLNPWTIEHELEDDGESCGI